MADDMHGTAQPVPPHRAQLLIPVANSAGIERRDAPLALVLREHLHAVETQFLCAKKCVDHAAGDGKVRTDHAEQSTDNTRFKCDSVYPKRSICPSRAGCLK